MLEVLGRAASAVHDALAAVNDWGPSGRRPGQYHCDLVADDAACAVLLGAGLSVLSEESGLTRAPGSDEGELLVVLDPIDGSTNAARGIPWYATSLCILDRQGPRVAMVLNQATGTRYEAVRGRGARRDGEVVAPSACSSISEAVIAISGYPRVHPGWSQFRALGAASLDICAVADGSLDGYLLVGRGHLYGWDYLGAVLVCTEAGAVVAGRKGEDLIARDGAPHWPTAAATPTLLAELRVAEEREASALGGS
jgi:fructose-1,6-bisphosphatase/inositol monophosphatase family enzyme